MYTQLKINNDFLPIRCALIVDSDKLYGRRVERELGRFGYSDIQFCETCAQGLDALKARSYSLVIVDIDSLSDAAKGASRGLASLRASALDSDFVVLSRNNLGESFLAAARAGVRDYLIKGPTLRLDAEFDRLITQLQDSSDHNRFSLEQIGFFRSQGVTPRELEILTEFSVDFPRHSQLAARLCVSEQHIRRVFSRIYEKLNLETLGQLVNLVSVAQVLA